MAKWRLDLLQAGLLEKSAERIRKGGKKITLAEIADATDVPLSTVGAYVTGKIDNPDLEKLSRITSFLGLKLTDMIEVDETGNKKATSKLEVALSLDTAPLLGS